MTKKQLQNNIRAYYLSGFFHGFLTTIPVWVSFYGGFLTLGQMALLQSLRYSMTIIFELPTGAFADLFGRKSSYALGMFVWGISSFLIGQSQAAWHIFAFVLLGEFGRTFISGAYTAWIFDSLKEHGREKELPKIKSLLNVFFQIAMAGSMILGGYTFSISQSLPYTIQAVALLAAAGITFFIGTEPKIDSEKFTFQNYVRQTKDGFTEIFKTKYIAYLSLFYVIVGGVVNSAQKFFNQLYATEIGFSDIQKGWLFAGIRLLNMVMLYAWTRSKDFSRDKTLLMFVILIAVSFIPAAIGFKWLGAFLLIGLTLGNSTRMSVLQQFVNEEFSSKVRSTALSALEMLVSFAFIAIVYASGFAMDRIGIGGVLSSMGVLASVILAPLSIWLIQYQRKENLMERIKRFITVNFRHRKMAELEAKSNEEVDA